MRIIQKFQELMKKLYFLKDKERGKEKTVLRLVEEVGELAEAILLDDKGKIAEEMSDVVAWTLSLANLAEVNLSKAFQAKYDGSCPECKKTPCMCDSF